MRGTLEVQPEDLPEDNPDQWIDAVTDQGIGGIDQAISARNNQVQFDDVSIVYGTSLTE